MVDGTEIRNPVDAESDAAEVMLTLAMLSYRACHDARRGHLKSARLRNVVTSGVEELPPTAGRFELVYYDACQGFGK